MAQAQTGLQLTLTSEGYGFKEKAVLAQNFYFPPHEEEQKEMEDMPMPVDEDEQMFDFSKQIIVPANALEDLRGSISVALGDERVNLQMQVVEDPPTQFVIKATITLLNKQIFEAIQELQKKPRTLTN